MPIRDKLNHLNMAGKMLLLRLIMMALVNTKLEVFLTKTPALSYIIKKCFMISKMELSLTRKPTSLNEFKLHVIHPSYM